MNHRQNRHPAIATAIDQRRLLLPLLLLITLWLIATQALAGPKVAFETTLGIFTVELEPEKAPQTVENFLGYVDSSFYAGTQFHRVIPDFMVQGGGFDADMQRKTTRKPVANELKNLRGTIAMARTSAPHSATAQFFVNSVDNAFLDHRDKTPSGWGYCVFGKVVEGMETIDAISAVATTSRRGMRDVPKEPVLIKRAYRLEAGTSGSKGVDEAAATEAKPADPEISHSPHRLNGKQQGAGD